MESITRWNSIFALCLTLLFAAGCGSGSPSNAEARRAIEQKIAEDADRKMELAAFTVTERLPRDHTYIIEFEGEVEFLEDARWRRRDGFGAGGRMGFATTDPPSAPASQGFTGWDDFLTHTQRPGTDHEAGERAPFVGRLVFERTDSGWRTANLEIR